MKDVQNVVAAKCWQAFDERLSKHRWMMSLYLYREYRDRVQKESIEGRMSRFAALNDQRLRDHFGKALERCLAAYKLRKDSLQMPVSEHDLEVSHGQLVSSIREMLEELDRELSDTPAFSGALYSLNAEMEECRNFLRQKNIGFWKAHSDEATRCAQKKNHLAEKQCGLLCLFNKVPFHHKKISQRHLLGCFPKSDISARMTSAMQYQVFEDWYSKDLAHDADRVWTHFYMLSTLVGLCVLLFFASCWPRQQQSSPQYNLLGPGISSSRPAW